MDFNKLCIYCLEYIENIDEVTNCPHCGKDAKIASEVHHQLKPYTILAGKYLVGEVLGEGGFGITYVGFDLSLELRVAIKEFYPNGYAVREGNSTSNLTIYEGKDRENVEKWKNNFIREARSLAKCDHLSGIVGVKDFFQENNTAYIVMEYLEGMTLKEYIKSSNAKFSVGQLVRSITPIISSLQEIHERDLIHRDISPDNIMLLPGGSMKLLDFGAARDYSEDGQKSLSVMLKPGYAPEEQYRTKGKQGPWSDVYALCATMYRCITGVVPIESMERLRKDELKKPSELGIDINPKLEEVLLKGMAVYSEDRYQSMAELLKDLTLYADETVSHMGKEQAIPNQMKSEKKEKPENGLEDQFRNIVKKTKDFIAFIWDAFMKADRKKVIKILDITIVVSLVIVLLLKLSFSVIENKDDKGIKTVETTVEVSEFNNEDIIEE